MLAERRWVPRMLAGSAGTGGASGAAGIAALERPGDGDLKVRSLIEPELLFLCRPTRPTLPRVPLPITLPPVTELCEPRRTMRLVCILPTGSGVVVCDRKAAAAAAEERPVCDCARFRKAELAAVAAAEEVLRSIGYMVVSTSVRIAMRRRRGTIVLRSSAGSACWAMGRTNGLMNDVPDWPNCLAAAKTY